MNESTTEKEVLETLWTAGEPLKAGELVEKTGLSFSTLMTRLQRLVRIGYVSTPKRGFYSITEQGERIIAVTGAGKRPASAILSPVSSEKAFRFYRGLDQSLGVSADSLTDFREKLRTVDLTSIEFHLLRQDFESWVKEELGDPALANRIGLIRTMNLSGDSLRQKLYETVESRCKELDTLL